jgi:hypothetical protein
VLQLAISQEVAMPVRPVSNHGGNVIGRFPSLKMKRMISFESLIECDYLYLLDYELEVQHFEEQPLTIEYRAGATLLHYTPDFHALHRQRDLLVECKPEALVETEENHRKFKAAVEWCAEHGWMFCVVTDQSLRVGFRLKNVKLLTRYARHAVRPEVRGQVYALLEAASSPFTLGQLAQALAPTDPPSTIASLLHLAFHHKIVIPLDAAAISVNSPVGLPAPPIVENELWAPTTSLLAHVFTGGKWPTK